MIADILIIFALLIVLRILFVKLRRAYRKHYLKAKGWKESVGLGAGWNGRYPVFSHNGGEARYNLTAAWNIQKELEHE